ncbi:hypothetical protein [Lutimonas zeaxanthinifaciens]|uniref:hypothetical protein n=1 Tax=Lutimonas zeaxanthinifaciens TaxID=3060215 RepID=UPI00265CBDD8|nr:hypothetical protein [Lutimonas sp. YSD2104]WKK67019.1 hypothetical protein QZH61_05200 [Lutimonas sp. YSD2104]
MKNVLNQYQNAHKWMLIPWIIIIIAFTPQYFMSWSTEPWPYHLHALSAMAWFALLLYQPYLATHGKIKQHRKWGMIGLFLAGSVVFSALSIVPTNVYIGAVDGGQPFFPDSFFYGLVFTETIQIVGFGFAVIMGVINSKKTEEHAIWMISSLFFGFMPAWARFVMFPLLFLDGQTNWMDAQTCLNIGIPLFILVVLLIGYRLKKLKHPAVLLSILFVFIMLFTIPIGELEWYRELVTRIMKPTIPWNI